MPPGQVNSLSNGVLLTAQRGMLSPALLQLVEILQLNLETTSGLWAKTLAASPSG